MKRVNKSISWARSLGLFTTAVLLASACSSAGSSGADSAGDGDETSGSDGEASGEVVEIELWHAMADELGVVVDELVDEYNTSQDGVKVTATFQGSYDDTFNSFKAGLETGSVPNIVQNFDIASQSMIDTGAILPASELVTDEEADAFIPAVRDYYSDENGMVAVAFNSSTPIVYYNADMFEEAGLDAPDPDWTFSEFLETCETLEANGVEHCSTFGTVGWFFEEILANSGGLYFDENNGRTGRATEAVFNQGQGPEVFDFLSGLIADGHAPNLGNTWSDTDTAFFAGEAAMIFDSTSGVKGFDDNADFEVKTTYIPHSDTSERNGVAIGGAALWLVDSEDDKINAAAWDFMSFLSATDQQVKWHIDTGYFPTDKDLQDSPPPPLATFWEQNPNFLTAIAQLSTTKTEIDGEPNYPVLGGRAGVFPDCRRILIEAYAEVIDSGKTAQEALDTAAEKCTALLEDYNELI